MSKKKHKILTVWEMPDAIIVQFNDTVSELSTEMSDWCDNMDSGGLSATPKYEEVVSAYDSLTSVPTLEPSKNFINKFTDTIGYEIYVPYGKRRQSRATRLQNARAGLESVLHETNIRESPDEEIQEFAREIQRALDVTGDIEFPSMF